LTEPESHTFADLCRIDDKLDRQHSETGARLDRVERRLDRIEDELLVLNGIVLRPKGREVEPTGLKAILDRLERTLTGLRRLTKLEGAQKE
jgi:hypothetical protein